MHHVTEQAIRLMNCPALFDSVTKYNYFCKRVEARLDDVENAIEAWKKRDADDEEATREKVGEGTED